MGESCNNALIVEGGAMRSVFSAGLLDGFLAKQFDPFDVCIGVSAGAYNLAAYMAGKSGRGLNIFQNLALRNEFISYSRFMRGGHLLDLDWLFDAALAESHVDFHADQRQGKPLFVGVTDVDSGDAVYVNTTADNFTDVIKASMSLPLLYREFPIVNGRPSTDGGVADAIPVAQAIRMGATRIMVVRSRHYAYLKKDTLGHRFIRWKLKKYPALTATMRERVKRHEDTIALIRNPPQGVKVVEICPPDHFIAGRFNRDRERLLQGYNTGVASAEPAIRQWYMAVNRSSETAP
jgi:predicted patatin/cPLA2 family phospholipase